VDPGRKISIFPGKFPRNLDFYQGISENWISSGKFWKNIEFFQAI